MSKWRKKPMVVEAFRLGHDEWPDWYRAVADVTVTTGPNVHIIQTLEGRMRAFLGDYIIRGVAGEIYPCKPDIFEATYEPVED